MVRVGDRVEVREGVHAGVPSEESAREATPAWLGLGIGIGLGIGLGLGLGIGLG